MNILELDDTEYGDQYVRLADARAEIEACVAAAVATERERVAAACWERRGHFASDLAARAFAALVRDGGV